MLCIANTEIGLDPNNRVIKDHKEVVVYTVKILKFRTPENLL